MGRFLTCPASRQDSAEQDGGRRGSVGDGFDVHGYRTWERNRHVPGTINDLA